MYSNIWQNPYISVELMHQLIYFETHKKFLKHVFYTLKEKTSMDRKFHGFAVIDPFSEIFSQPVKKNPAWLLLLIFQ